ncbi:MAG: nickel-dependent lactate racemase [Firmicutes bacterium]|nr:nickel-dependent lactate racemase [Bacillota bacterium]
MMTRLPYGPGYLPVTVPDENLAGIFCPLQTQRELPGEAELIIAALQNPYGGPRLAELAASARRITVISSDHTRPLPSKVTLPPLLAEIRAGNPQAEVTILIATGLHRPTTPAELTARYGKDLVQREHFVVHNAFNTDELVYLGGLPSGAPLWVNRLLAETDLLVAEGFIEPHFFAGFSGGPKSVLPGVAGEKSVLANHSTALMAHPRARTGNITDNPIHQDIRAAARLAGLRFILNVVTGSDHRVTAAFAGSVAEAHAAGCRLVEKQARIELEPADIVITSNGGYPLDQNLYQAVKSMSAGEAATKPGGTIIIAAECRDGLGGEGFYSQMASALNPRSLLAQIQGTPMLETLPDQWQVQVLARILAERQVIVVTEGVERELLEEMYLTWAPDLDTALRLAFEQHGAGAKVAVIPDGVQVIVHPQH